MDVMTVCNRKGGMGKSTTVVNLSRHWAAQGKRVLVIDLDSQGHATLGLIGHDAMLKKNPGIHKVLSHDLPIGHTVIQTHYEGLAVIPADLNFNESSLPPDIAILKVKLEQLSDSGFDLVIIDTPPSLSNALLSALACSNWVLVPFIPHSLALMGVMQLSELFKDVALSHNPSLKLIGLLPIMEDRHIRLQKRVINTLSNRFGSSKLLRGIRTNIALAEAFEAGSPIQDYAPKSRGALDYHMLAHELDLMIN